MDPVQSPSDGGAAAPSIASGWERGKGCVGAICPHQVHPCRRRCRGKSKAALLGSHTPLGPHGDIVCGRLLVKVPRAGGAHPRPPLQQPTAGARAVEPLPRHVPALVRPTPPGCHRPGSAPRTRPPLAGPESEGQGGQRGCGGAGRAGRPAGEDTAG